MPDKLRVASFMVGPLDVNCHVAHTDTQAVAVDPGGDPAEVMDYLKANGLKLTHILLTHLHFDHLYGVSALAGATGAEILASAKDQPLMRTEIGAGGLWGLPKVPEFGFRAIEPGPLTLLGRAVVTFLAPGHSPGSLIYHFPEDGVAFTGDVLFYRSIGRSDLPLGDQDELVASIRTKVYALPEDTVLYPGHGPETTVGDERRNNPFVSDFT